MMDRIEMLFKAADDIAIAIKGNLIPMTGPIIDPLSEEIEEVSWPATWFRYKKKVKEQEVYWGRQPLSNIQWMGVEMYLESQFGLKLKDGEKG